MQSSQEFKNDIKKINEKITQNYNYKDMNQYNTLVDNVEILAQASIKYIENSQGNVSFNEALKLFLNANKIESAENLKDNFKKFLDDFKTINIDLEEIKKVEDLSSFTKKIENEVEKLGNEEKEKFKSAFSKFACNEYKKCFKSYSRWDMAYETFRLFNDAVQYKDEYVPMKGSYKSFYSNPEIKFNEHPYDKDIDKALENPTIKDNKELVEYLKKDKEILVGAEKTNVGENYGRDSYNLFEKQFIEYSKKSNLYCMSNEGSLAVYKIL